MNAEIEDALRSIDVSTLDYTQWTQVGMALKEEGLDWRVWDEWSRNDPRYKDGECQRKWDTFAGAANPVTISTVFKMARERGWVCKRDESRPLEWDDVIEYDGNGVVFSLDSRLRPSEQLRKYLYVLFRDDECVGIVTSDVWYSEKEGKWFPKKGYCDRTAGELMRSLEKHPDDIGASICDWKEECGAWIRFNPLDGKGVKNENVTSFRFALVESDEIPVNEQEALYRRFQLPIAALVYSGGKSLHAIVHIDADSYDEYRKRVDYLYSFLETNGLKVDKQNRNPSRLSRLPGVTRNGVEQTLVGTNIGRKSWSEWMDYAEGESDEYPAIESISDVIKSPPELPEALIGGVLRVGHKMLVSGPSKAGKSFSLMELAFAISEGRRWLGFECRKSRVLYVNLEIDRASSVNRFLAIFDKLGCRPTTEGNLGIWNLRGHAAPLDRLLPKLIRRIKAQGYEVVIIDPIYKVITGDENSASEMAEFVNHFDRICDETKCSVIYCHHHSKGEQGRRSVLDRASGSGVFARDPDALIDFIELEVPPEILERTSPGDGATPWRVEGSMREFKSFKPFNCWFLYPLHVLDANDDLKGYYPRGSGYSSLASSYKRNQSPESRRNAFDSAFDLNRNENGYCEVDAIMEYLSIGERTLRNRIKEMGGAYRLADGMVIRTFRKGGEK